MRQRGHQIVDFSQDADAYVVNSCSVTAVSDQKSRQALHKIRRERPGAVLALCGCYAQTHPGDMEQLDADLIAGTGDRGGFITLLERRTAPAAPPWTVHLTAGTLRSCPPEGWTSAPGPC